MCVEAALGEEARRDRRQWQDPEGQGVERGLQGDPRRGQRKKKERQPEKPEGAARARIATIERAIERVDRGAEPDRGMTDVLEKNLWIAEARLEGQGQQRQP
ncbi:hypothetical protein DSM21852_35820 [Methylocystis bryophila]|nr:hypothetical protein DSM21852_35820 [Methylocystis bryophila]